MNSIRLFTTILITCSLSACISAPKRVSFTNETTSPISVPGFTSSWKHEGNSEVSVFFPELQYANFPSKLVLMITNHHNKVIHVIPEKHFYIKSNTHIETHYGIEAKKVLDYFSNSAFGKDCKVDPARTMAGYIPPENWNITLKSTKIKPGETITGYLLVDPNQAQLSQLQLDVDLGDDRYHFDLKSL